MKEELLKGLTNEQIIKFKECKNNEEVLKLAKEEGIELTDEQLEAVSGGCGTETWPDYICGNCHQAGGVEVQTKTNMQFFKCRKCGNAWYRTL